MKLLLLLLILTIAWPLNAPAESMIRQVQEELRKRKVFFGDVDGRDSRAFRAALRHYQESRGFPRTGKLDDQTMDALDILEPVAESGFPDGVVLRSDPAPREKSPKLSIPRLADRSTPAIPQEMAKADQAALTTAPTSAAPSLKERMQEFIEGYLTDAETNRLDLEMSYYAPVVDYFDHGEQPSSFVHEDVAAYYNRWPERHYKLLGPVRVSKISEDLWEAEFEIGFEVKGEDRRAKGKAAERFTIDTSGSRWNIVRMKEQRLP